MMKYFLSVLTPLLLSFSLQAQVKNLAERLGYPKDAKLVIIHADDLGVSHSETAASTKAMEIGSVSSASIMVPCPWLSEIAAYAVAHPGADLGLHLTLTSEWKYYKWSSVSEPNKVTGLLNEKGMMYSSVDSVAAHATGAEIKEEIRNQVLRAEAFGIDPTHLDSHMGTLFARPDYFKAYLETGHEFQIPVFIPDQLEGALKIKWDSVLAPNDVLVNHVLTISPPAVKSGSAAFYNEGLKKLQPGLTYLIIHTAYDDAEMQAIAVDHPDWGAAWRQADYNYFTSDECKQALKENNIHVITWKEIRDKITRAIK